MSDTYRVIISPQAVEDLIRILDEVAKQSPQKRGKGNRPAGHRIEFTCRVSPPLCSHRGRDRAVRRMSNADPAVPRAVSRNRATPDGRDSDGAPRKAEV